MAKKKTPDNILSSRCVPVRFTEAQYADIARVAKIDGVSITHTVRSCVVDSLGLEVVPVKCGPRPKT